MRHLLVLGAGLAVVGVGVDADAAAWCEEADDLDVLGLHQLDEILHDGVHAVLVEVAVVAEAEEVELQRLGLHHALAGEVVDADFGEVGLSGDGAEGGELRAVEAHPVVVVGVAVLEGFEDLGGVVALVFGLAAEGREVVLLSIHWGIWGLLLGRRGDRDKIAVEETGRAGSGRGEGGPPGKPADALGAGGGRCGGGGGEGDAGELLVLLAAEVLEDFPYVHQATGDVEAAFPLAALQGQQHFALAVEVTVPFRIFGVAEVAPGVVVDALEPVEATLVAGELIALDEGDERLEVYPPELLIELEFMAGLAEAVHEVEDASELLVPPVLDFGEADVHRFPDEFRASEALAEVHDEPHRLDGMAGVELAAVEAIDEVAVLAQGFDDEAEFGAVEDVHDLMQAVVDGLLQEGRFEEGFNLKSNVAENHGQVEGLQRAGAGRSFVPAAFGVVGLGENDVEGALGDGGIFLASFFLPGRGEGYGELSEGDGGEGVGEDVVGLHEGMAFAVEGEVPVEVAVVAVLLQELGSLDGGVEPFLTELHGVIELGEHPYLAALQPDELVGVIDAAVAVEAGEIAAEVLVLGLVEPEWDHAVEKFGFV